MNTHEKFQLWISRDLDGELGSNEQQLLSEHLRECTECTKQQTQWSVLTAAIHEDRAIPVVGLLELRQRIADQVESQTARPVPAPQAGQLGGVVLLLRRSAAAAAVLALILLGTFQLAQLPDHLSADPPQDEPALQPQKTQSEFLRIMKQRGGKETIQRDYLDFFCPGNRGRLAE